MKNRLYFVYPYKFLPADFVRFDLFFLAKFVPITIVCPNWKEMEESYKYPNIFTISPAKFLITPLDKKSHAFWIFCEGFGALDFLINLRLIFSQIAVLRHYAPGLPPTLVFKNTKKLPKIHSLRYLYFAIFRILSSRIRFLENSTCFVAGSYWSEEFKQKSSNVRSSISYDVNIYGVIEKTRTRRDKKYMIFLDGAYGFGSDSMIFGRKLPVTRNSFYKFLSTLLSDIETRTGCSVICVSHPKRRNTKYANWGLEGFESWSEDWQKLVPECSAVISVNSTAIVCGILEYKPIILINPKRQWPDFGGGAEDQEVLQQWLGCAMIGAVNDDFSLNVETQKYDNFLELFHKGADLPKDVRLGGQILDAIR